MQKLIEGARKVGLNLTPDQVAMFRLYRQELVAWQSRANLTAITDDEGVQTKHFLDSLSCLVAVSAVRSSVANLPVPLEACPLKPDARVIDVGSGAGFPGLPLKIICPTIKLTLLEATGKKVEFLKHIVELLDLRGVTVLKSRAEELGSDPDHRERYDWALARAVAEMPTLMEYLLPFVRIGGRALAQKGEDAPAEVARAEAAIVHLGGQLNRLIPVELTGIAETRYLVIVDKVAATPEKYPRRPGMPSKHPISNVKPQISSVK
jgi:16S rRNA (guanine527-N7)-methyltransferase